MATTPIADQIDDHIALEFLAVVDGDLSRVQYRFRIVAVDMKNRRLNHLGDVGTVLGRASVIGPRRRETDLVVDHDVQRTAGLVTAGLRHLKGFHHHALAGKGGVAMHHDRQNLLAVFILAALLTGANRAFDDR